jgi:hypothetical protein
LPAHKLTKTDRYHWYSNRALTALRRFARAHKLRYYRERAEIEEKEQEMEVTAIPVA